MVIYLFDQKVDGTSASIRPELACAVFGVKLDEPGKRRGCDRCRCRYGDDPRVVGKWELTRTGAFDAFGLL